MSFENPRKTWRRTAKELLIYELSVFIVFVVGCLMWKYIATFHFEQFLRTVSMWIIIMPVLVIVFVINDRYHLTEDEERDLRWKQYVKLRKEFDDQCNHK